MKWENELNWRRKKKGTTSGNQLCFFGTILNRPIAGALLLMRKLKHLLTFSLDMLYLSRNSSFELQSSLSLSSTSFSKQLWHNRFWSSVSFGAIVCVCSCWKYLNTPCSKKGTSTGCFGCSQACPLSASGTINLYDSRRSSRRKQSCTMIKMNFSSSLILY